MIVGLILLLAAALSLPTPAGAVDSDLKHAYAFKVKASNGYSIFAYAANERADGRGQIVLFVFRGEGGAIYSAPATLTATSVEAHLGVLGRVSLVVTPAGEKKRLRSRCGGEGGAVRFEPQRFSGSFEFHGEEGFADAVSTAPREYNRFFYDLLCAGVDSTELGRSDPRGARLRLHSGRGDFRLALEVRKNRPGKRARFEVEVHEKRHGIGISRSTQLWAGAGAFDYDPLLRTATLEPPLPFSGRASFHRGAVPANRWSGDLTVDLPGRSGVRLVGPGLGIVLTHPCLHQGEGGFRC